MSLYSHSQQLCSILYSSAARFAARTKHLNVWHEHGRSNVTVHLYRQQGHRSSVGVLLGRLRDEWCAIQYANIVSALVTPSTQLNLSMGVAYTLLVPANIRTTTSPDDIETSVTHRLHCAMPLSDSELCYPSKISPPIVLKLTLISSAPFFSKGASTTCGTRGGRC